MRDAMQTPTYESALFPDTVAAEAALARVVALGYDKDRISVIVAGPNGDLEGVPAGVDTSDDLGVKGASVGAAAGGVIGAIVAAAVSVVAIAGTAGAATPFVIGPLAAALVGLGGGAVTGSIVGGLLDLGDHADDWQDWVQKGGAVVAVDLTSPDDRARVKAALAQS